MIISDIDVPNYPLEKSEYSFDITVKNLGPDKCCEIYQNTEFSKDGNFLGGLAFHATYECWVNPDGNGILPDQSATSSTGLFNFNETGSYTVKSNIKCLLPGEGNIDNGVFETSVQIK